MSDASQSGANPSQPAGSSVFAPASTPAPTVAPVGQPRVPGGLIGSANVEPSGSAFKSFVPTETRSSNGNG